MSAPWNAGNITRAIFISQELISLPVRERQVAEPHRPMTDADLKKELYYDALMKPNASLSRSGFWVIMGVIIAINVFSMIGFLSRGAFPIIGFLGLDILAVWLAFKVCFKDQTQWTRVRISPETLRVDHRNPKGVETHIELPTAFARVELKEPVTVHSWVTLSYQRQAYVIGRVLTVDERKSLVEAMRDAIQRARTHRYAGEVE